MQIATELFGDVLVAHTPDDLTEDSALALLTALRGPIEKGNVRIVLQMDRTDTYDSQGLTAILDLQDEVRQGGGNLKISGLGHPGRKIFEVTRLDRRLDIFESVIDAVASFH